jgi:hypothetical protein
LSWIMCIRGFWITSLVETHTFHLQHRGFYETHFSVISVVTSYKNVVAYLSYQGKDYQVHNHRHNTCKLLIERTC